MESAEDPVLYLDEALEDLAGRRTPVGHLIVWHAVDNDAPKAVLVRAPVRVDMEASAVDGTARDDPIAAVEVLGDRREIGGSCGKHGHVDTREHQPGQACHPAGRYDAQRYRRVGEWKSTFVVRGGANESVRLGLRVPLPAHLARATEVSRKESGAMRRPVAGVTRVRYCESGKWVQEVDGLR